MYKVFFNDRKLFLTDDFTRLFQEKYGLFYKFREKEDLQELIDFYRKLTRIDSLYVFHSDLEELRAVFQECFIPLYAAGGLVKNQNNEYLLIFRHGKWDLPKGKLDKNENFEEAALREVEEECGISALDIVNPLLSTYHTYDYKEGIALKKTRWFEMCYDGHEKLSPQKEEGIEEVRWISRSDLGNYLDKSFPAVRDVFIYAGL